jgi:hypothetical protein
MRAAAAALTLLAVTAAPPASHARPLIVGDSVTVAAAPKLRATGWDVDARINRTMSIGLRILRSRRRLPRTVAIALGTNATVSKRDIATALRIVGPARHLVLVTPREVRGMGAHDAQVIRVMARRHPLRIVVVDWAVASQGRWGWLAGDRIHLTAAGTSAYTRLLSPIARDAASLLPRSA